MNNGIRYVGLDVHQATISVAVLNSRGKLLLERIIETNAAAVVALMEELGGPLYVAFEEGTWAMWLYALLQPRVAKVVVCDPRKISRTGTKSDRIDARELAHLLRCDRLSAVYHHDVGLNGLRELARTYVVLTKDQIRVMNRIKALYRSWAIACGGTQCYAVKPRPAWLAKLPNPDVRHRAEIYYQQLDSVRSLRQQVRADLLKAGRKHRAYGRLRQIEYLGPIRAVLVMAFVQSPHRFRGRHQLWGYCGLGLETHASGEYRFVRGELQRWKKAVLIRGLNRNHHHELKAIFKSAATQACAGRGCFRQIYDGLLQKGVRAEMARLTVARKMAAVVLILWKKGESFDPQKLTSAA